VLISASQERICSGKSALVCALPSQKPRQPNRRSWMPPRTLGTVRTAAVMGPEPTEPDRTGWLGWGRNAHEGLNRPPQKRPIPTEWPEVTRTEPPMGEVIPRSRSEQGGPERPRRAFPFWGRSVTLRVGSHGGVDSGSLFWLSFETHTNIEHPVRHQF
jgi:hypothetical protein